MKQDTQTPDIIEPIPGQIDIESVLDDTHASEQVQSNISNQQGQTGGPANDTHAADPVRSNITPITHARAKRTKQKSASQVQNGQSVQIDQTGLKSPENALKCDADNQVRKTGRKPGTKDVVPRKKRTDFNISDQIPADEKQQIVRYNVELFSLGKLKDPNDEEEVRERLVTYFSISEKYQ